MFNKKNFPIFLIVLGLIIFLDSSGNTNSQVYFGVRYHDGPVSLSFSNYPYVYSPAPVYYSPSYYYVSNHRHHRYYRECEYYKHDRGWHKGWYKHHRHRDRD